MNIIKHTQISLLIDASIRDAQEKGESLNITTLRGLIDNLRVSDIIGGPLFSAIKLQRQQPVDYLNTHNVNIKTLNLDYRTITATMNWTYSEIDKLNTYIDMMSSFFNIMQARIQNELLNTRKRLELGRNAVVIDFKDRAVIDQVSTAAIDFTEGKATLRKLSEGDRIFKFKDPAQVSLKADFLDDSVLSIEKMNTFFDPAFAGEVFFTVLGRDPTLTRGRISFRLDEQDVAPVLNTITIRSRNNAPTKMHLIIVDSDGIEIPVGSETAINQNVTFTFASTTVQAVIIELEQNIYYEIVSGLYEYVFRFGAILLENALTTGSDMVQSEAISAGEELTAVTIRTIDMVPTDTEIKYYVSSDAVSWSKITPTIRRR